MEKTEALDRLRVHNFESREWSAITFPEPVYSAFPGGTPDYESREYRYHYQNTPLRRRVSSITIPALWSWSTLWLGGNSEEVLGGCRPISSPRPVRVERTPWATARRRRQHPDVSVIVYAQEGGFSRAAESSADALRLAEPIMYGITLTFSSDRVSPRSTGAWRLLTSHGPAAATSWVSSGARTVCL